MERPIEDTITVSVRWQQPVAGRNKDKDLQKAVYALKKHPIYGIVFFSMTRINPSKNQDMEK